MNSSRLTKIEPDQIKKLNTIISAITRITGQDPDEYRHECVYVATGGRSESSRDMTWFEANQLIKDLNGLSMRTTLASGDRIRKSIFSMCYNMKIIRQGATTSEKIEAINTYIAGHEKIGNKKKLNEYSVPELQKLAYQFSVFYKSYLTKLK